MQWYFYLGCVGLSISIGGLLLLYWQSSKYIGIADAASIFFNKCQKTAQWRWDILNTPHFKHGKDPCAAFLDGNNQKTAYSKYIDCLIHKLLIATKNGQLVLYGEIYPNPLRQNFPIPQDEINHFNSKFDKIYEAGGKQELYRNPCFLKKRFKTWMETELKNNGISDSLYRCD